MSYSFMNSEAYLHKAQGNLGCTGGSRSEKDERSENPDYRSKDLVIQYVIFFFPPCCNLIPDKKQIHRGIRVYLGSYLRGSDDATP